MRKTLPLILILGLAGGCTSRTPDETSRPEPGKIRFDLDVIRPDGLRGPEDGLVAVSYEFCVPDDKAIYAEVRRIDPSVTFHRNSPGRAGCGEGLTLCIGNTHQPDWNATLLTLSALPYVREIRECYYE